MVEHGQGVADGKEVAGLKMDINWITNWGLETLGHRSGNSYIFAMCIVCKKSVGITNSVTCSNGKLILGGCSIKLVATVCVACGCTSTMKYAYGNPMRRMYSKTTPSQFLNTTLYKRLSEISNSNSCSMEVMDTTIYLDAIVGRLSCEVFTVNPSEKKNGGLIVRPSVSSDMIRS